MRQLVLLDRDGTINVEKHYLSSPDQIELLPCAPEGIHMMRSLGLIPVIVTNQSAIARGYFDLNTLNHIHDRLQGLLSNLGAPVDAIYTCPHRPEDGCSCRKPSTGLALKAAEELRADLSHAFVVGDKECDIELGKRVGAVTILVRTGYGAHFCTDSKIQPDYVAKDLLDAAHVIQKLI